MELLTHESARQARVAVAEGEFVFDISMTHETIAEGRIADSNVPGGEELGLIVFDGCGTHCLQARLSKRSSAESKNQDLEHRDVRAEDKVAPAARLGSNPRRQYWFGRNGCSAPS
jgi:hypothetical protein